MHFLAFDVLLMMHRNMRPVVVSKEWRYHL